MINHTLRSPGVISKLGRGGIRALPWVVTRKGAIPLATIMKVPTAIEAADVFVDVFDEELCGINNCDFVTTAGIVKSEYRDVHVYPNPVTCISRIITPDGIESVRIYDMIGSPIKVYHPVAEFTEIKSSDFVPGLYILAATTGERGFLQRKLVIR